MPRAYANIEIEFPDNPLVSGKVGLHGVFEDTSSPGKMLCPTCTTTTKAEQRYTCEHGHGPFYPGETLSGLALDDERIVHVDKTMRVNPDDPDDLRTYADIRYALPPDRKGKAMFRAHPADQVRDARFRPGPKQYSLTPPSKATEKERNLYQVLLDLAAQDDVVWMAHMRVKDSVAAYRLELMAEGVAGLVEVIHPSAVKAYEAPVFDHDERLDGWAARLRDDSLSDLDPDAYADRSAEDVMAFAEKRWAQVGNAMPDLTESVPAAEAAAAPAELGLADLLAASLPVAEPVDVEPAPEVAAAPDGVDKLMAAIAAVEAKTALEGAAA